MNDTRDRTNEAGRVKNGMARAYYLQVIFFHLEHYFKAYPLRQNGQDNDHENLQESKKQSLRQNE